VSAGHGIVIQRRSAAAGVPTTALLRQWARAARGEQGAEITLRIVEEAEMTDLNTRFRRKPYPTNVLSFPFGAESLDGPILGDVVVCAPVVAREAAEQGKALDAHWAHLVVHGILHLLGHDHEVEVSAAAMETRERAILAELGFGDPYL
jgi:probable rRNA maturation factor